jgi:hypothetical protein
MMGVICKAVRGECGFFAMRTGFLSGIGATEAGWTGWQIFWDFYDIFSFFAQKVLDYGTRKWYNSQVTPMERL